MSTCKLTLRVETVRSTVCRTDLDWKGRQMKSSTDQPRLMVKCNKVSTCKPTLRVETVRSTVCRTGLGKKGPQMGSCHKYRPGIQPKQREKISSSDT